MSFAHRLSVIIPLAADEGSHHALIEDLKPYDFEIIIASETSRAASLNAGAARASRDILWFLHADSRVLAENISALEQAFSVRPEALHYFQLFYEDAGITALNAIGANIRSRLFGLPYGDQGFCISKDQFLAVGEYPDSVFGEDLLFVRMAKQADIKLHRIPSKLLTSARKYKDVGWLRLTLMRQIQMWKLMRQTL